VIPWEHLDSAPIPGSDQTLRLKRRGREYSIMLGTNELMNSRLSGSEEALAQLSITKLDAGSAPHVLIGGLGMGFTLRAALAALPTDATVTVAELVPAVVAWAKGPMAEVFEGCLDDPRVAIHEGDVGALIRGDAGRYDAILLDVDNGPEGLSRPGNDGLYDPRGLQFARAALKPGGVLSVWSAAPDTRFTRSLQKAGFAVEEAKVKAHRGRSGTRHVIWLAVRGE
jgi:spermidine synthase